MHRRENLIGNVVSRSEIAASQSSLQWRAGGKDGNSPLFYDRHDEPEGTYEDYGPGVYQLDSVQFSPWLNAPVKGVGPLEPQ